MTDNTGTGRDKALRNHAATNQSVDEEILDQIQKEYLTSRVWHRWTRLTIAVLATIIPVGMLVWLVAALSYPDTFGSFLQEANMWLKIAIVSGTFLSFIFVFGALVRGVFTSSSDANGEYRPEKIMRSVAQTLTEG